MVSVKEIRGFFKRLYENLFDKSEKNDAKRSFASFFTLIVIMP